MVPSSPALMTQMATEEPTDVFSVIESPQEADPTPTVNDWLARVKTVASVTVTVRTLVEVFPGFREPDDLRAWSDVAIEDARAHEAVLEEGWPEYS